MLGRQAGSKLGKGPIRHSKKVELSSTLLQTILVSYTKEERHLIYNIKSHSGYWMDNELG